MPNLRILTPQDLPALIALEQECHTHPWSAAQCQEIFNLDYRHLGLFAPALTAYAIWRPLYDEAELLTIATAPSARQQGLAKHLLSAMHGNLRLEEFRRCHLEVRASNSAAQALYLSLGYTPVGRRASYYTHPKEDALLYTINLAPA